MNQKNRSAASLAASLADDPEVEDLVKKEISSSSMVRFLTQCRIAKGLTQEQIAVEMSCNASKISRLESNTDENLKWSDITGYSGAMNMNLSVAFEEPNIPAAVRIKDCVLKIHQSLKDLTELAKQVGADDDIAQKINQFSGDVLIDFLAMHQNHSQELQSVLKYPSPKSSPREDQLPKHTPEDEEISC